MNLVKDMLIGALLIGFALAALNFAWTALDLLYQLVGMKWIVLGCVFLIVMIPATGIATSLRETRERAKNKS